MDVLEKLRHTIGLEPDLAARTGETCPRSGLYECEVHTDDSRIALSEGETFPPCGVESGHETTWKLVKST